MPVEVSLELAGRPQTSSPGVSRRQGAGGADAPRVWLVLGDKRGDNAQVEIIEQALGWPCERKNLVMLEQWVLGKPRVQPSLHHLDLEQSDPLEPPWPDLILTIGRRPSMAALWVREQSGGRTRIALVGKPSTRLEAFDLIVSSGEAWLPPLPNVLPVTLPLMRVDQEAVQTASTRWSGRLGTLPRPLIAFLIGGPTSPFRYDESVVRGLASATREVVEELGGTAYVSTSRRTPKDLVRSLRAALPPGAELFEWTSNADENPYQALLGLADGFVVTADSVSMIVEVVRQRRALVIFPLPSGPLGVLDQLRRSLARRLFSFEGEGALDRGRRTLGRALYRAGVINQTRDFRAFHRDLMRRGLAAEPGGGYRVPTAEVPDDLPRVVGRVRALLE